MEPSSDTYLPGKGRTKFIELLDVFDNDVMALSLSSISPEAVGWIQTRYL